MASIVFCDFEDGDSTPLEEVPEQGLHPAEFKVRGRKQSQTEVNTTVSVDACALHVGPAVEWCLAKAGGVNFKDVVVEPYDAVGGSDTRFGLPLEGTPERRHYDLHSRTMPMSECNQPECRRAASHA